LGGVKSIFIGNAAGGENRETKALKRDGAQSTGVMKNDCRLGHITDTREDHCPAYESKEARDHEALEN